MNNSSLPWQLCCLLLWCCFCCSRLPTAFSAKCHKSERATLLKVKSSLGIPPADSTWWDPATDCCEWGGVSCNDGGRVYYIALGFDVNLINENVKSTIPPAIADLPALIWLHIADMPGIHGPIPPSFAKLVHLEMLRIHNTSISGAIPSFIANLKNLTMLELSYNKITGTIPSWLSFLQTLELNNNMLTGTIPPELTANIDNIDFSYNQLTGEVPRKYSIYASINFAHNKLTGDASFTFGAQVTLDLSWNQFEFDITGLNFSRSLEVLDLSHNKIRGTISESFRALNRLRHLDLSYNKLCGRIPAGRASIMRRPEPYLHNKCLCGTPLPPCHRRLQN